MGGSEKAPTHFFRGVEVPNCRRTQICAHRRCKSTEWSIRNFFMVNQMNSRRIMCNFLAWIQRSPDNIGHWLSKNRTWVQVQRSGEFVIFIRRPRRWQSNWTLRYSRFNSFQCFFLNDPYPLWVGKLVVVNADTSQGITHSTNALKATAILRIRNVSTCLIDSSRSFLLNIHKILCQLKSKLTLSLSRLILGNPSSNSGWTL